MTLLLSGCSARPDDVMASQACPDPLRRTLVAEHTSAPGSNDDVGAATPSPPIDPTKQHPITATATFHPDDGSSGALPVTVSVDDGTGGGIAVVEACQVLSLQLALDAGDLSTPYGQVQSGRLQVTNDRSAGSLRLIDQPTYIREADDGSGAQDYGSITGWYVLVEKPVAGRYRTQRFIRWQPVPRPAGPDVGPAGHDSTARAETEGSLTGAVDLEITVG